MFSTPTFIIKINKANYKGHVYGKLIKELNTHLATLNSYEFKRLKTFEKQLEDIKVKTVDLSDMTPLEGQKKSKKRREMKNINCKQPINKTFNIISTNKSWK